MGMSRVVAVFLGCLFVYSGNIFAQDAEKKSGNTLEISEIAVSADRFGRTVSAMPNTVSIITREDVKRAGLVKDTLQGVLQEMLPQFCCTSDGFTGRGETFRGKNPLYMLDGIPQHNPGYDTFRDQHFIDMDMVERIEVIHGSNSMQGAGATGAVINIITKSAAKDELNRFRHNISVGFSSDDNFQKDGQSYKEHYDGSYNTGFADFAYGYTHKLSGLQYDGNNDQVGLIHINGQVADSTNQDYFFKVGFEPKKGHRIQATLNHYFGKGRMNYLPDKLGNRLTGELQGNKDNDGSQGVAARNIHNNITLDYKADDFHGWNIVAQMFRRTNENRYTNDTVYNQYNELTVGGDPYFDQNEFIGEKLGIKTSLSRKYNKDIDYTFGLDVIQSENRMQKYYSKRNEAPITEALNTAGFVQGNYDLSPKLSVTAGVRVERVDLDIASYIGMPDYCHTCVTGAPGGLVDGGDAYWVDYMPNIGVIYDVNNDTSLYANFNQGFTSPDYWRILRDVGEAKMSIDVMLKDGDPIITDNYETGVKFDNSRLSMSLVAHYSECDACQNLILGSDNYYDVMRQKTRIWGYDVTVGYKQPGVFEIGGAFSDLHAEYDSDENYEYDTQVAGEFQAPPVATWFFQVYPREGMSMRLTGKHLIEKDYAGPGKSLKGDEIHKNSNFSESISTLRLSASQQTKEYGDFSLGIENLLDTQYVTYYSQVETSQNNRKFYSGPGRTLNFRWSKSF